MNSAQAQAALVTALLTLGALLKHVVPSEAVNRWIPLILVVAGTPAYCALVGSWTPADWLQAFLSASAATGLHQTAAKSTGLNL